MMALPSTASSSIPAASTMPAAMAQNRKAMSSGSLMAGHKSCLFFMKLSVVYRAMRNVIGGKKIDSPQLGHFV